MKKRILTLIVAITTIFSAQAQLFPSFDLGLKAGANFTSLRSNGNYFDSSTKAGFLAGAWARVGVLGFHIQPELYYTSKNTSLNRGNTSEDVKFSTVDVPVLLGTKIGLGPIGARIQAGPLFSFIVDKDNVTSFGSEVDYKKNFAAIVGGVGVDISKLSLDLRYEAGLGNINRGDNRQRLNLWTLAIGYNFL
ncbi:porin family protein [Sphingobacterium corticibacter]|uniref:PorT family protein n=1 Tax=Sphingobacterium corticibacter TaxID=2171749 RepID=A0A2T8HHK5_9SPHI|nr:porin family protein [Sphingobacterium corticibacter]PVH24919.1 PorT family protein [Sphingobacterium corticibacter]